jgi:hypothetical protein
MTKESLSFEDILRLFTDMDTDEKATAFHQKLKDFLDTKSIEERRFIGSIFLSITRDNAAQLLSSIEQKGDIDMLKEVQRQLSQFA